MKGKHLLITGASGFLGEALTARLYKSNKITALARNEGNLLKLKQKFPSIHILTGSISDLSVCLEATHQVDGIFHLAGFKHVGLAETQAKECISTNILGTANLLYAMNSPDRNVEFIIGTSTDKAAQVAGVYGASKLIMEKLFMQWQTFTRAQYRIVRYGNVLYSTGSVLYKWKDALINGKPLTITDPEATRFYWSVEQAVDLIFDCLQNSMSPAPFVPRMKAMRLGDILIAMQYKYGGAVEVVTKGLGMGENMHERIIEGGPTSEEVERYTVAEILELV